MKLYYLEHSGLALVGTDVAYIFDYYKDPKGLVKKWHEEGKYLVFFVSHVHYDHFSKDILSFEGEKTYYIAHEEVPLSSLGERVRFVKKGDAFTFKKETINIDISVYGSTDEGVSFYVEVEGKTIFHSGDLNWWHWSGEREEEQKYARDFMEEEFSFIPPLTVDILCFPVDARQGEAREWGLIEVLHHVKKVGLIVPIHANGEPWQPSSYMKARYREQAYWIPREEGEVLDLDKQGWAYL